MAAYAYECFRRRSWYVLPVAAGFNHAFVEHESRLLGSDDLLYDPYDDGMAPISPERVHRNPDGIEIAEPYAPPDNLCEESLCFASLQVP